MLETERRLTFTLACFVLLACTATISCGAQQPEPKEELAASASAQDADTAKAASAAASTNNGDRTLTFVSQCKNQTIRLGVNGGYVQDCGANNSCPTGTTCLTARKPPGCFWEFPAPRSGSPVLGTGDQVVYQLDDPPITNTAGQTLKWSGNVYASTECASDGTGCLTAMCPQSQGGVTSVIPCPTGVGPQGPVTLAEFTFGFDSPDFYDISIINGVNIPVAMAPDTTITDADNSYFCQAPGSPSKSSTGLLGCSWTFDPSKIVLNGQTTDQSTLLRAVAPGGDPCGDDGTCTSGVCGRQLELGTNTLPEVCGTQIGWWTADEICVFTGNNFGDPVDCNTPVPDQQQVTNLYGCDGFNANSCYNKDQANPTCCGCPNWVVDGTTLPVDPGFQCYGTNTQWTALAEPWAAFLKDACPTAYTFPFDDATSTFTCNTPNLSQTNPNTMNYTITFCPGGLDGT